PANGLGAVLLDRLPDQLQGRAQQPGDMHLGDAELLGDLRLRTFAVEPQDQDAALPGRHLGQGLPDRLAPLDEVDPVVLLADRLSERPTGVLGVRLWGVQRHRAVSGTALQSLQDLILAHLERVGELPRTWGAAEIVGQLLSDGEDLPVEIVQRSRNANGPALVGEISAELAENSRDGEGYESVAALGIVTFRRTDQAEHGDLDEFFDGLAPSGVAMGEIPGQLEVLGNEPAGKVRLLDLAQNPRFLG